MVLEKINSFQMQRGHGIKGTNFLNISIQLSPKVFIKGLLNADTSKINSGIPCNNILNCLMITFEHELTHGIMFCLCRIYEKMNNGGQLYSMCVNVHCNLAN